LHKFLGFVKQRYEIEQSSCTLKKNINDVTIIFDRTLNILIDTV